MAPFCLRLRGVKLDPKLIYLQAERFLYCDHRLRSPQIMTTPQDGAYVALPAVVLSVFASELYLSELIGSGNIHRQNSPMTTTLGKRIMRQGERVLGIA